jgi:hypothetical protein
MTLNFTNKGSVHIDMGDNVRMVLGEIPPYMEEKANTAACSYLFDVNDQSDRLNDEKKDTFVHYVTQLLYLSQQARPDIRTTISFLCTRLINPGIDDYKKLTRMMKYLQGSIDLSLILSSDNSGEIQWWVDVSFATHPDMKGHRGGTMSMGTGSVYSTSIKQKMVTWSSTESEVVGVYDVLPQIICTSSFMQDQGLAVNHVVL